MLRSSITTIILPLIVLLLLPIGPADGQGQTCTYKKLDLAILIDSSDSISDTDLQKIGNFVEALLENLPIGLDDSRVLLMQYADNYKWLTKFKDGISDAAMDDALSTFRANPSLGGSTATFKALSQLYKQYQKGASAGYRGEPDNTVTLVITDGASNTLLDTIDVAQRTSKYTTFYGIGIGQAFVVAGNTGAKTEMSGIVGCADYDTCDKAFTVTDFDSLLLEDFVENTIGSVLCVDDTTLTTTTTTKTATTTTATTTTATTTTVSTTTFVCFSEGYQGPIAGKMVDSGAVIRTERNVATQEACSEVCDAEDGCLSFSHRSDRGTCRLSRSQSHVLTANAAFDTYIYHDACTTTTTTASSTTETSTSVTVSSTTATQTSTSVTATTTSLTSTTTSVSSTTTSETSTTTTVSSTTTSVSSTTTSVSSTTTSLTSTTTSVSSTTTTGTSTTTTVSSTTTSVSSTTTSQTSTTTTVSSTTTTETSSTTTVSSTTTSLSSTTTSETSTTLSTTTTSASSTTTSVTSTTTSTTTITGTTKTATETTTTASSTTATETSTTSVTMSSTTTTLSTTTATITTTTTTTTTTYTGTTHTITTKTITTRTTTSKTSTTKTSTTTASSTTTTASTTTTSRTSTTTTVSSTTTSVTTTTTSLSSTTTSVSATTTTASSTTSSLTSTSTTASSTTTSVSSTTFTGTTETTTSLTSTSITASSTTVTVSSTTYTGTTETTTTSTTTITATSTTTSQTSTTTTISSTTTSATSTTSTDTSTTTTASSTTTSTATASTTTTTATTTTTSTVTTVSSTTTTTSTATYTSTTTTTRTATYTSTTTTESTTTSTTLKVCVGMILPCLNGGACASGGGNTTAANQSNSSLATMLLLPEFCACPGGFTGEFCGTPGVIEITSSVGEDDEASNAAWAAFAILPLVAAAVYFHKTRATSGNADLGSIDFESATHKGLSRRNSFEAVATAMFAADPIAFELVIDKLATEGLRTEEGPTSSTWDAGAAAQSVGTGKSANQGEVPIMLSNDISVGSAEPYVAAPAPIALLMSPDALRVMQSEDSDMKRSRSYGDALNTVSLDETEPASALVGLPPAFVQVAMVEHRRPSIVAGIDPKTLKFRSVKRSNPLFAVEHHNQGVQILEDEEELVNELNGSVFGDAVEGGQNASDDQGEYMATEATVGTPVFGAQREHQANSPLAQESIVVESATSVGLAGKGYQPRSQSYGDALISTDGSGISEATQGHQSSLPAADAALSADGSDISGTNKGYQSSPLDMNYVIDDGPDPLETSSANLDVPGVTNRSSISAESTDVSKAFLERQHTDWGLLAPTETLASPTSTGRLNRQGTEWGLMEGSYGAEELQPAEAFRQGQTEPTASVVGATAVAGTEVYRSSMLSTASMPLAWEAGATQADGSPVMTAKQGENAGRPRLATTDSATVLTSSSSSRTIWINQGDEAQLLEADGNATSFADRGGSLLSGSSSSGISHNSPVSFAERVGSPLGRNSSMASVEGVAAIPLANARQALQRAPDSMMIAGISAEGSDADNARRGTNRTMSLSGVSTEGSNADNARRGTNSVRTISLSGVSADGTTDVDSTQSGTNNSADDDDTSAFIGMGIAGGVVPAFAATSGSNDNIGNDGATSEDVEEFMAWFAAREAQFVADDNAATEAAAADLEEAGLEASAINEGTAVDATEKVVVVSSTSGGEGGADANSTAALFRAHVANNGDQFETMPMEQVVDSDLFRAWLSSRYAGMDALGDDEVDAVYNAHQARQEFDAAETQAGGLIDHDELDAVYNAHREGQTFDEDASRRLSATSTSSNGLHPNLYSAAGEPNTMELSTELPTAFFGMREAMISDFAEKGTNAAGNAAPGASASEANNDGVAAEPSTPTLFVAEKGSQPDTPWSPTGSALAGAAAVARGAGMAHITPNATEGGK